MLKIGDRTLFLMNTDLMANRSNKLGGFGRGRIYFLKKGFEADVN